MVATRSGRGAKTAEVAAVAHNTLKAPPKRATKRKAVEEAPAEPAPKALKPTKTEPKKKPAPKPTKAATKAAPKTAPKAAVKTTRRTAKVVDVVEAVDEIPEPAPEPEPVPEVENVVEPKTTRRAVRGRKPAVTETTKEIVTPAPVEEPAAEPALIAKPVKATRARKQPILEANAIILPAKAPSTTTAATRATRGRRAVTAPAAESPLKAPARKPGRKPAVKATSKVESTTTTIGAIEEPFTEYPNYPNTPAHIKAPLSTRAALKELPANYPNTPAHISKPLSNEDALAELADYPKTPAHIAAAFANQKALTALPEEYPRTPAHVAATLSSLNAFNELPADYPKTPAHITDAFNNYKALNGLPDYPKTPAHIAEALNNHTALNELPDYPKTPAHIAQTLDNHKALNELPDYPKTPAHIAQALDNHKAFNELPDYPKTPAHVADAYSNQKAFDELAAEYPKTPAHVEDVLSNSRALNELPAEYPRTPAHIAATFSSQQALDQLPDYPQTPAHIVAPLIKPDAVEELPTEASHTPAHNQAPLEVQDELTALPSDPSVSKATENIVEEDASILTYESESEPEDMSFELTGPILEIQPESSLIEGDESILCDMSPALNKTFVHNESLVREDEHEDVEEPSASLTTSVVFAAPEVSLAAPSSPGKRSALRSPMKSDLKTPKKTVTWNDDEPEVDFLLHGGPLRGMRFFVDVTSNGKDQSFLFTGLLEDMGAQVQRTWDDTTSLSHVLFKDGKQSTLEKVVASKGVVKCVNLGWILDSEKNKMRMDEVPYLVDLSSVKAPSPLKSKVGAFTPARTPSKYSQSLQEKPGSNNSLPSTPTSSEFDRSMNFDDKENSEIGIFFTPQAKTCPKPKFSWLLNKSPMKTPSKVEFLKQTPMKAFSTTKKSTTTQSFGSFSLAPPKKLRFV